MAAEVVRPPGLPAGRARDPSARRRCTGRVSVEQPWVVIARRCGQHQRGQRTRRCATQPGAGRAQHKPAHSVRRSSCELLGQAASPRVPQHVDAVKPRFVHQTLDHGGQTAHPHRKARSLRHARSGWVKADQLQSAGVACERCPHLQVRADPGDQQQRTTLRRIGPRAGAGRPPERTTHPTRGRPDAWLN